MTAQTSMPRISHVKGKADSNRHRVSLIARKLDSKISGRNQTEKLSNYWAIELTRVVPRDQTLVPLGRESLIEEKDVTETFSTPETI